ncbi:MAG: 30S ribosomal protein S15 [Candidatus Nealsonbacteria bacterium]|nr:30S ribosomal protein S15 [Candidatus Nealsonbacteria bacterium]
MLKTEEKQKLIKEFKVNEKDTGSTEVQLSLVSEEIKKLLTHLKKQPKDFHSKRGLLKMVAKRRKLLAYLKKESSRRYGATIKKLGLKK